MNKQYNPVRRPKKEYVNVAIQDELNQWKSSNKNVTGIKIISYNESEIIISMEDVYGVHIIEIKYPETYPANKIGYTCRERSNRTITTRLSFIPTVNEQIKNKHISIKTLLDHLTKTFTKYINLNLPLGGQGKSKHASIHCSIDNSRRTSQSAKDEKHKRKQDLKILNRILEQSLNSQSNHELYDSLEVTHVETISPTRKDVISESESDDRPLEMEDVELITEVYIKNKSPVIDSESPVIDSDSSNMEDVYVRNNKSAVIDRLNTVVEAHRLSCISDFIVGNSAPTLIEEIIFQNFTEPSTVTVEEVVEVKDNSICSEVKDNSICSEVLINNISHLLETPTVETVINEMDELTLSDLIKYINAEDEKNQPSKVFNTGDNQTHLLVEDLETPPTEMVQPLVINVEDKNQPSKVFNTGDNQTHLLVEDLETPPTEMVQPLVINVEDKNQPSKVFNTGDNQIHLLVEDLETPPTEMVEPLVINIPLQMMKRRHSITGFTLTDVIDPMGLYLDLSTFIDAQLNIDLHKLISFGTESFKENSEMTGFEALVTIAGESMATELTSESQQYITHELDTIAAIVKNDMAYRYHSNLKFHEVMVIGPVNTSYAYGCYHFKIYCPSNYPATNPVVVIMTPGYYKGNPHIDINNTLSDFYSISQVIKTIHTVFCVTPNPHRTRLSNVNCAMLHVLQHPIPSFEIFIESHFRLRCDNVKRRLQQWLTEMPKNMYIEFKIACNMLHNELDKLKIEN